ncbi:glycosyltransferase [Tunicatimonas pelagia]|uniref:glycosyltransferase n=1 Tax=Tunicatimonas pelagia TaxID=931531 RepID=UPI0026655965|nr:glycosyltransferase [Tunicatimonas pelagia]WKN40439.1 glycosyltransferase [Tunicatimonas pelagia]
MTENNSDRTLILESGFTGHRGEYISHLMRFINDNANLHDKYIFFLNEKIVPLLGQLTESPNYFIEYVNPTEARSNFISQSFYEWTLVAEKISQIRKNINEIIFMSVDEHLILLTTRRFKKFNLSVKGVLFQPYVHYKNSTDKKGLLRNYISQKYATALNKSIKKLFILNDEKTVCEMNKSIKRCFAYLPDPIEDKPVSSDALVHDEIIEKFSLHATKKHLLVFGMIDERKNITTIIDALRLLPSEIKKSVHLLIIGRLDGAVKKKYQDHIHQHQDEINITFNDQFATKGEMEVVFTNCHIVLMPYINFYSSSGILGHAIKHQKNVVASNQGLVGRLVAEKNLGIAVNPLDPKEIKDAICQLIYQPEKYQYQSAEYLHEYSPENFSRAILTEE